MVTEPIRRRFTVAEFHRMGEAGIFSENDRLELIEGEIIQMSPIGPEHAGRVNRLTKLLVLAFGESAVVSVQNPLEIVPHNEPQPDFLILKPRADSYCSALPAPDSVLLLIEVSDSSLRVDRSVKLPIYARSGVPETWIVDLRGRKIELHRNPGPDGYRDTHRAAPGEEISPVAFPGIRFSVSEILG